MSPSTPERRPWTIDERKKLDDLLKAGKTGPEIATALQRTAQSIYSQLHRLDIKRKKAGRRVVAATVRLFREVSNIDQYVGYPTCQIVFPSPPGSWQYPVTESVVLPPDRMEPTYGFQVLSP